jgi:hypothetical protein
MNGTVKVRLQYISLVGGLFVASVGIIAVLCPFAGPSTGDLLLFMLGGILASHLLAGFVSLFLRTFRWTSALLIGLICLLPAACYAGLALKSHIYLQHYAAWDRFRDQLANPVPKSVTNLRFNTVEEEINGDLSFRFNIAPTDLQEIIRQKGFKLVQPDAMKCPKDYFKYPYYLPVRGPYVLYQGVDHDGNVSTLKVNEAQDQVIFREESSAYYEGRYWETVDPTLVKMGQDDLARLKKEWEGQSGSQANDGLAIRPATNRTPSADAPSNVK